MTFDSWGLISRLDEASRQLRQAQIKYDTVADEVKDAMKRSGTAQVVSRAGKLVRFSKLDDTLSVCDVEIQAPAIE